MIGTRATALLVIQALLFSLSPGPLIAEPAAVVQEAVSSGKRTASLQVSPEAGGSLEINGLKVEVPADAVNAPTTITVTMLSAPDAPARDLANATAGAAAWRFEPHGTRFKRGVRITMPFERELLSSEAAVSNLFVYFYDERERRWERLERVGVDAEAATVSSVTRHFTDMIAATLRLPEGPAPISFDPNAIKRLQAARPDAGVPAPEGLSSGPYGNAAFRIPLRLPPGRGAASPALALSYSSDAGATWLGRGFDVEIPRVQIDTRFGLPRYDGTDSCLLDGEELVCTGSDGDSLAYRSRTERSFARVRWHRGEGESWWEVTDKSGVTRDYGRDEAWLGPRRDDRSRTFIWFLSKVRDAFGNTTSFDYQHDAANGYTYLSAIRYAGFEDGAVSEPGLYRVAFLLEPGVRPDRRVEARGGFASKLARRLQRIEVACSGETVRAWSFRYRQNEFGQSLLESFAEHDAEGRPFYSYGFDYYALPERRDGSGAVLGYDGFGESEVQWPAIYDEHFQALGRSRTTSAGASLYAGIRIYTWWLFKKRILASFGVRGGAGESSSITESLLLDVNGDGLPDAVWREGSSLVGYLNTGAGFDVSREVRFDGTGGAKLEREKSRSVNLGASASFGPLSGGVSLDHTWSEARTAFADVDGDGLADFVEVGESAWARNTGLGFEQVPWSFGARIVEDTGPDPEQDNYRRTFHRQEPLRRWKAYRAGTVQVEQSARLATPERASADGVALHTHAGARTDTLVVARGREQASSRLVYDVAEGDCLYFRMDCGEDDQGDDVEWNVRVRYLDLALFGDLDESALFQPVAQSQGIPYGDARLLPIYTPGVDGLYTLKSGWESLGPTVLSPVTQALLEHSAFAPRRIPLDVFEALVAAAGDRRSDIPDPEPAQGEPPCVPILSLLLASHRYEGELKRFVRVAPDADRYMPDLLSTLPLDRRREIALCRWIDGSLILPRAGAHTVSAPALERPAEIAAPAATPEPGMTVWRRGVLLDAAYEAAGDPEPAQRLWLRREGTGWQILRESGGQEAMVAASVAGGEPLLARVIDVGVEQSYALSGRTSLLQRLPASVYESEVTPIVLGDERFAAVLYATIPAAAWDAIVAGLTGEQSARLAACYRLEDGLYRLDEAIGDADLQQALQLLDARAVCVSGSLFKEWPGLAGGARGFVLLSAADRAVFAAAQPEAAALMAALSDSSQYYVRSDLTGAEQAALESAMTSFRRDQELFPYYALQGEQRSLRAGLSQADRTVAAETLGRAGLSVWTTLDRSIKYDAVSRFAVSPATLPEGCDEERFAPRGPAAGTAAGGETTAAVVPVFEAGVTVLANRYVHVFDSNADYASESLVDSPALLAEGCGGAAEPFAGGAWGWFYGLWVGYHAWSEDSIARPPQPVEPPAGQAALPPYFLRVAPNVDEAGSPLIQTDGYGWEVPPDAWVGEISRSSSSDFDEADRPVQQERAFAAWLRRDRLHASRNGGDAYYGIPSGAGEAAGGMLGQFRASRAKATDVNGGVGIAGLGSSFGSNSGSSWQYRGLLDLNGDRYPELVMQSDRADGGHSLHVSPGTGSGFADEIEWTTPFRHIGSTQTRVFGFGGSTGGAAGGLEVKVDEKGKPTLAVVKEAQVSGGGGVNGTLGSSWQQEGFVDFNGDGLPDHVRRDGGEFAVALNTGAGFAAPVSWGGGSDVTLFGGAPGLETEPRGLSHTMVGSFGASAGVSVGVGVVGAGASGGFAGTVNQTLFSLVDCNGDGLPDQVSKANDEPFFRVRYNLGDALSDQEVRLYRPDWAFSREDALRAAVEGDLALLAGQLGGLVLPRGCRLPGFGGLPGGDSPFGEILDPLRVDDTLEHTAGASFSLGANLSLDIPLFLLVALSLTFGINGATASTSATVRFADIDGDGLPDHVTKLPFEDFLRVKLNASGKSGLLRSLALPQGGRVELDYARAGNTPTMPQSRWVLASVARTDGLGALAPDRGEHRTTERHEYSGGIYDRRDRLFHGFGQVRTTLGDGSTRTTRYANSSRHTRGMAVETRVADAAGSLLAQTLTRIQERVEGRSSGHEVVFPAVTEETQRVYGSGRCVESRRAWGYDDFGNVSRLEDNGDTTAAGDELTVEIVYAALGERFRAHPESLRVRDAGGRLLRQRRGSYGARGELLALERWGGEGASATWRLEYDRYGNLASSRDPRGYSIGWLYDDEAHRFVREVSTSNPVLGGGTYRSRMEWDLRLGLQTAAMDAAGNRQEMRYDGFGRLVEVRSPYDTGPTPAVAHEYRTATFPWEALTENKLRFDPADSGTLATVVTIDGLGRPAQTAKRAEIWGRGLGWICSGAVAYDSCGRVVAEGQPVFAEGEPLPPLAAVTRPTLRAFDALDRPVSVQAPDGACWTTAYRVPAAQRVEVATDPMGRVTERELDGRGAIVAVRRLAASGVGARPLAATPAVLATSASGGAVLTGVAYGYNALGEMIEAVDFHGNATRTAYDLAGRRIRLESPDAGVVEQVYDDAGNLVLRTDSVLRGRGEAIAYTYDGHNRLVGVAYPRMTDVRYVYGEPSAAGNAAGRLVARTDESGAVSFSYGKLGETVATSRTLSRLTPLAADVQAEFAYVSDYLGRLEQITYPDGEVVSYSYDRGGQVSSVTGVHGALTTAYVQQIGYDEHEQRAFVRYGNGVETRYTYDPDRRWLQGMRTDGPWGQGYQRAAYELDAVGNVLQISNAVERYDTRQGYDYDDLDQLTRARGTTTARPHGVAEYSSTYEQTFAFDPVANMTRKRSSERTAPVRAVGAALAYDLDYAYTAGTPHRAERIGGLWYRYDANGNVGEEREGGHGIEPLDEGTISRQGDVRILNRGFGLTRARSGDAGVYERRFAWDEENRLKRVTEGSRTTEFRYGADGQRSVKLGADSESLYFDAMWQVGTDYPDLRQSKHIYVGSQRVATRLNIRGHTDLGYEQVNTYYYHSDHLGSAQVVSDHRGEVYEHIEYTPYGELWVEEKSDAFDRIPFRFTAKEWDEETQLYYYGARYLDPRASRWMSADPALGSYLPGAGAGSGGAAGLPGMGGVFRPTNLNLYHYGGNNPLAYRDEDGNEICLALLIAAASAYATALMTAPDLQFDIGSASDDIANQNWFGLAISAAAVAIPAVSATTLKGGVRLASEVAGGVAAKADDAPKAVARAAEATAAARQTVRTPYGEALQSTAAEALAARQQVQKGGTLYRIGTTGKSAAGEAQFWALENPLSPGYASRYGVPPQNIAGADFVETARLKAGTPFITRPAPGYGSNLGGGIEVVVPPRGVELQTFVSIP